MRQSCAQCSPASVRTWPRDLVVLNAAAALHVRTGDGLLDCAARAHRAIDDGAAMHKLEALAAMSQVVEGAAQ